MSRRKSVSVSRLKNVMPCLKRSFLKIKRLKLQLKNSILITPLQRLSFIFTERSQRKSEVWLRLVCLKILDAASNKLLVKHSMAIIDNRTWKLSSPKVAAASATSQWLRISSKSSQCKERMTLRCVWNQFLQLNHYSTDGTTRSRRFHRRTNSITINSVRCLISPRTPVVTWIQLSFLRWFEE